MIHQHCIGVILGGGTLAGIIKHFIFHNGSGFRFSDDFLVLGGHSLLANRLVNKMNKLFGTTITLVEVFSRPMTIEEMALLVEDNLLSNLSDEEIEALMNGE